MKNALVIITIHAWFCVGLLAQSDGWRGRVVAGVEVADVRVVLEGENGRILTQTMTDARGVFVFRDLSRVGNSNDQYAYVVVIHEGFKTYRERVDWRSMIRGASTYTIYLQPEESTVAIGTGTVAVSELSLLPEVRREYERAMDDAADGDHDEAVKRLERVVAMAPEFYSGWVDLGNQYNASGEIERAVAAYGKAIEIDPENALAFVDLGALRYQEGERARANGNADAALAAYIDSDKSLQRAIELDPGSVEAYFHLGVTLYRMGQYAPAESALLKAIEIGGPHAQARLTLLNVYNRIKAYDLALEQANLFLDENPEAPEREAIERARSQVESALGRQ